MPPSSSKMKKPAAVAASPGKASPRKQAKLSQDKQVAESALKGLPVPELVLVKKEKPSPKKPHEPLDASLLQARVVIMVEGDAFEAGNLIICEPSLLNLLVFFLCLDVHHANLFGRNFWMQEILLIVECPLLLLDFAFLPAICQGGKPNFQEDAAGAVGGGAGRHC